MRILGSMRGSDKHRNVCIHSYRIDPACEGSVGVVESYDFLCSETDRRDWRPEMLQEKIPTLRSPRRWIFSGKHLGVRMELGDIRCSHSGDNNQCIGKRCPYNG